MSSGSGSCVFRFGVLCLQVRDFRCRGVLLRWVVELAAVAIDACVAVANCSRWKVWSWLESAVRGVGSFWCNSVHWFWLSIAESLERVLWFRSLWLVDWFVAVLDVLDVVAVAVLCLG